MTLNLIFKVRLCTPMDFSKEDNLPPPPPPPLPETTPPHPIQPKYVTVMMHTPNLCKHTNKKKIYHYTVYTTAYTHVICERAK